LSKRSRDTKFEGKIGKSEERREKKTGTSGKKSAEKTKMVEGMIALKLKEK